MQDRIFNSTNQDRTPHQNSFMLIDTIFQCVKIVEEVLLKEKIIAVDCEGIYLSKEGRLTLMQISLTDERVFIFDILKGGSLMFLGLDEHRQGLKAVLENKKILKLIHDCRNDWDSLLYQYSVRIYNFIDTQEAYFVFTLFYYQEIALPISLLKFIEIVTHKKLEYKEKFKSVMTEDPFLWKKRPLSEEQLKYAAEDVCYLLQAWLILKEKFNENLIEIIYFLTILKVVDRQMFLQFGEYLAANIFYYTMLENVFTSKYIYDYIFAVDYIFGFLQIKSSSEINDKEKEIMTTTNETENTSEQQLNPGIVWDDQTSQSIIKHGFDFKRKQRVLCFKKVQEEEMMKLEKRKLERYLFFQFYMKKNNCAPGIRVPENLTEKNANKTQEKNGGTPKMNPMIRRNNNTCTNSQQQQEKKLGNNIPNYSYYQNYIKTYTQYQQKANNLNVYNKNSFKNNPQNQHCSHHQNYGIYQHKQPSSYLHKCQTNVNNITTQRIKTNTSNHNMTNPFLLSTNTFTGSDTDKASGNKVLIKNDDSPIEVKKKNLLTAEGKKTRRKKISSSTQLQNLSKINLS